jgi:hypothetical protein
MEDALCCQEPRGRRPLPAPTHEVHFLWILETCPNTVRQTVGKGTRSVPGPLQTTHIHFELNNFIRCVLRDPLQVGSVRILL